MTRLLVSNHTPTEGGVYLLDTGSGAARRISDEPGRGITRGPDGYYFVENYGAVFHVEPESWKVTRVADTGYVWCHDLRWIGDSFYLVASKGNRVVRLDRDFRVRDTFQIVEDEDDVCHANCLEEADGELLLSIFTLTPGPRNEKNGTEPWRHEGKILRLDWERKRYDVLYEPLSQPHSLTWTGGQIYYCESFTSKVGVVSGDGRDRRTLCKLSGFVRGLAFANGSAFVGITRRRAQFYPPLLRWAAKALGWCGVLEMDPETWKPRRRFPLPGRQVYDVRAVEDTGP